MSQRRESSEMELDAGARFALDKERDIGARIGLDKERDA
jgi:hypothetical protein